jgi:uncharacterized protein
MMPETGLSAQEKAFLLKLARDSIQAGVNQQLVPQIDRKDCTPLLLASGASFVTLTIHGQLRGCIGALEAYQPLVYDVQEHALAAALDDYRFYPLSPQEIPLIHIEISRLTQPVPLEYSNAADLLTKLRVGIDGVILFEERRRATFLPQVWKQIPSRESFLSQLCQKMGAPADTWKKKHLDVSIYQVEEFEEE